ncbi:MAG: histidine kinase, partial [Rubrivivax sp.]
PTSINAVTAALRRSRRRLPRTLVYMVALCLGIAALLSSIDGHGDNIGIKLVYSFCVGFSCWGFTELGRLLQALAVDALRRRRGLPPSPSGFDSGWRGILPATLLAMLAGPSLGLGLGDLLTGRSTPSLLNLDTGNTRVTLALTVIGSLASIFILSTMERLASARTQAEAAQRQAAEHQLRLLQSQLEPHMLFNTLANLRVLIGLDADRAQAMLDHIINFLRSTLEASRLDRHPLAAEFERTADYLALMAVRMGPRLRVALDLPEALRAVPVPPLLLQPLVENAIQHGLEPKVEGGRIAVSARRDGNSLLLQVQDSGLGLGAVPSGGTGFGTRQVHERLATLYGTRASLQLEAAAGGGVCASVRLPLD